MEELLSEVTERKLAFDIDIVKNITSESDITPKEIPIQKLRADLLGRRHLDC